MLGEDVLVLRHPYLANMVLCWGRLVRISAKGCTIATYLA